MPTSSTPLVPLSHLSSTQVLFNQVEASSIRFVRRHRLLDRLLIADCQMQGISSFGNLNLRNSPKAASSAQRQRPQHYGYGRNTNRSLRSKHSVPTSSKAGARQYHPRGILKNLICEALEVTISQNNRDRTPWDPKWTPALHNLCFD